LDTTAGVGGGGTCGGETASAHQAGRFGGGANNPDSDVTAASSAIAIHCRTTTVIEAEVSFFFCLALPKERRQPPNKYGGKKSSWSLSRSTVLFLRKYTYCTTTVLQEEDSAK
jgi:hypothetical protein